MYITDSFQFFFFLTIHCFRQWREKLVRFFLLVPNLDSFEDPRRPSPGALLWANQPCHWNSIKRRSQLAPMITQGGWTGLGEWYMVCGQKKIMHQNKKIMHQNNYEVLESRIHILNINWLELYKITIWEKNKDTNSKAF